MKTSKRPRGGASIPCPRCKSPTRVLQTRRNTDKSVWRERNCPTCKHVFDTREQTDREARVAA